MMLAALQVTYLTCLAIAVFGHDRLVRGQYLNHREQWEIDGRPSGLIWRAPGSALWDRSALGAISTMSWLFLTPHWIASDPKLRRLLALVRVAYVLAIPACVAWFVLDAAKPLR